LGSVLAYEWYFDRWIDNGVEYYDDSVGVQKLNRYRARGSRNAITGKQGYWVYWRAGKKQKVEIVQWYGKLKSRKIVLYHVQGSKLKEGYYKNNKMDGFWVFWTKTEQVDREKTGLYKQDKLVRNARKENFPMPSAGHPYDRVHSLIQIAVWATSFVILLLLSMSWILLKLRHE